MRRTYAPTGIVLGVLLGLAAAGKTGNDFLGIVVAVVVSAALWVGIRAFENMLSRGVDKASDAIMNKYEDKKHKH